MNILEITPKILIILNLERERLKYGWAYTIANQID